MHTQYIYILAIRACVNKSFESWEAKDAANVWPTTKEEPNKGPCPTFHGDSVSNSGINLKFWTFCIEANSHDETNLIVAVVTNSSSR